ncbi:MAG: glutamine synthetase family protein, partial [Bacillota bacterium]|nr:glutamine synthetase family protein [Bacillota bacterium]
MVTSMKEASEFFAENDVRFIRLQFCDIFGQLKNISANPDQLKNASEGIGFDASSIKGFLSENESCLFLYPDPTTMCVLPWRPQAGRVVRFFCDIKHRDGSSYAGDSRRRLKEAVRKAEATGCHIFMGAECEFYLFETDENGAAVLTPHDDASYFDVAPRDKGENIRREICLTLEEMGLAVETSHHESGPGQHEIVFKYANALATADNLVTFKSVVKTIAQKNGAYASFMPKPLNKQSGSGMHINISAQKGADAIFEKPDGSLKEAAGFFIAGILSHIKGITAIANPLINSYKRIGFGFEAPKHISWHYDNRSQLIRIPESKGSLSRMELRSPDPSCNPYLVFAILIEAGL